MTSYDRARSLPERSVDLGRVAERGWTVADLLLPALTLRDGPLRHNAALFARWCAEQGVAHYPHAKTHLSPELVALQLESGAAGMTAATVSQARLLREFGARKVLIANEVVDQAGLAWLAGVLDTDPGFEVAVLVDSIELVAHLERRLADLGATRPLGALVERGAPAGRAGARSDAEAVAVGMAVAKSASLELVGVEGYEGVAAPDRSAESLAKVDALVAGLVEVTRALDAAGAFAGREEIVLSAGGSSYVDRAVAAVGSLGDGALSKPVRVVVRSGAYLSYEHGPLAACSPLSPQAGHRSGTLRPALELWAAVLSTPEPGLAILGFGKRDAPFDVALPTVLGYRRGGAESTLPGAAIERVNDQHAYLRDGRGLACGDVVRLGISHPCTAFDKWPVVPVLDEDDRVVDVVTTWF